MRFSLLMVVLGIVYVNSYPLQCISLEEEFGKSDVSKMLHISQTKGLQTDSNQACVLANKCMKLLEPFKSKISYSKKACKNHCSTRGYCLDGKCYCHPGYSGSDCSEESCPNLCSANGVCHEGKCLCNPGTGGLDCSESQKCPEDCSSNGICQWGKCFCHPGFFGENCSKKMNCPSNCNNHGICSQGECYCLPGWRGPECKLPLQKCPNGLNGNVCSGNGECDPSSGLCKCIGGYRGTSCSVSNHCAGQKSKKGESCFGNGVCVLGMCHCLRGFTGDDCSIGDGGCPNDCSGNGVCDTGICKCFPGYEGHNCGRRILNENILESIVNPNMIPTISHAVTDESKIPVDASDMRFSSTNTKKEASFGYCSFSDIYLSYVGLVSLTVFFIIGLFLGYEYHKSKVAQKTNNALNYLQ